MWRGAAQAGRAAKTRSKRKIRITITKKITSKSRIKRRKSFRPDADGLGSPSYAVGKWRKLPPYDAIIKGSASRPRARLARFE
jgi:hypothetical protein